MLIRSKLHAFDQEGEFTKLIVSNPYPAKIFCPENVASLLCLLHILKLTPDFFNVQKQTQ